MSDRKKDETATVDVEKRYRELVEKLEINRMTDKQAEKLRKKLGTLLRDECNSGALDQITRAVPDGLSTCPGIMRQIHSTGFYLTFEPLDGQDSALSRLMVMMTEGAANSAERALTLDATARTLELNLASKLALTVAALSEALDRHRRNRPAN
jgi:hypothetical protein